ncbi:MAG: hypothetical protein ACRBCT_07490 [Alphaproteobacteria bacterium]
MHEKHQENLSFLGKLAQTYQQAVASQGDAARISVKNLSQKLGVDAGELIGGGAMVYYKDIKASVLGQGAAPLASKLHVSQFAVIKKKGDGSFIFSETTLVEKTGESEQAGYTTLLEVNLTLVGDEFVVNSVKEKGVQIPSVLWADAYDSMYQRKDRGGIELDDVVLQVMRDAGMSKDDIRMVRSQSEEDALRNTGFFSGALGQAALEGGDPIPA